MRSVVHTALLSTALAALLWVPALAQGTTGPCPIRSAVAPRTLPAVHAALMNNAATLRLRTVNGRVFTLKFTAH
jgi:hypothetical protein